jgi:formate hydrogenlyase transcriptional activator
MIDESELAQPALDASPTAIVIIDGQGTIVLVNQAVEARFGYARQEIIGRTLELLIPDARASLIALEDLGTSDKRGEIGFVAQHKDGTRRRVNVSLNPVRTADGPPFRLLAILDVAARPEDAAAERAALEQQLAFEHFLGEMSSQFINLPTNHVTDAIRASLQETCEQLGVERSAFFRVGADRTAAEPADWIALTNSMAERPLAPQQLPWTLQRLLDGETVMFSSLANVPNETDRNEFAGLGMQSAVCIPLSLEGKVAGGVIVCRTDSERGWPSQLLGRISMVASIFNQVLARLQREDAAHEAARHVKELKERLEAENVYLRQEERERLGLSRIIGQTAAVHRVLEQIEQVAATDSTVLLLGETGTGKELFATHIHELSSRRARAMVRVNCAAIPATLIESELFGRERGAFTGAMARQAGRFELADQSTIFLDEIGDLPSEVQVKLLRVLEERTIERLGSPHSITVNTRIIAATHRNLEQRVAEGTFREDLFYRLNVFPIQVPPLRDRSEDIPLLVWRFVEEFSKAFGKRIDAIDRDTLAALQQYSWPGNIRELRNVVERAMIVATARRLTISLPHSSTPAVRRSQRLLDVEKEHIRGVLESTGWRIRGAGAAAERLGLKPTTLETRMAKLGLKRPGHRS